MDKNQYKGLVAEYMRRESELKSKLEIIGDLVKDNPNDMMLGEKVRFYVQKLEQTNENQLELF